MRKTSSATNILQDLSKVNSDLLDLVYESVESDGMVKAINSRRESVRQI